MSLYSHAAFSAIYCCCYHENRFIDSVRLPFPVCVISMSHPCLLHRLTSESFDIVGAHVKTIHVLPGAQ